MPAFTFRSIAASFKGWKSIGHRTEAPVPDPTKHARDASNISPSSSGSETAANIAKTTTSTIETPGAKGSSKWTLTPSKSSMAPPTSLISVPDSTRYSGLTHNPPFPNSPSAPKRPKWAWAYLDPPHHLWPTQPIPPLENREQWEEQRAQETEESGERAALRLREERRGKKRLRMLRHEQAMREWDEWDRQEADLQRRRLAVEKERKELEGEKIRMEEEKEKESMMEEQRQHYEQQQGHAHHAYPQQECTRCGMEESKGQQHVKYNQDCRQRSPQQSPGRRVQFLEPPKRGLRSEQSHVKDRWMHYSQFAEQMVWASARQEKKSMEDDEKTGY